APDDAQGQKCYPYHNFVLQIRNVCNYLPQVTKNQSAKLIESHHLARSNVLFQTLIRITM
ncbi:hypothetical protein, partial [Escherichia coli]|uniref:hypothetical protein n=1 Tax=Escherichia coli TaxID=562 RepID=UPI001A7E1718